MQHYISCGQNSLDTQDYVSYTADNEKQALTNQFNICRTKRNITDYDREGEISENKLVELIEEVLVFKRSVMSWLRQHHPSLFKSEEVLRISV